MYKIKVEINCVEYDAMYACQVLEQRLKGFEIAGGRPVMT